MSKKTFWQFRFQIIILLLILIPGTIGSIDRAQGMLKHPRIIFNAVAAGDATENSVILWTRMVRSKTNTGIKSKAIAQVATDPEFKHIQQSINTQSQPARDYIIKIDDTGLQSNTRYYYRFVAPRGEMSQVGTFKTAPHDTDKVPLHFAFSGDTDARWRPYPLTKDINQQQLDFFIFLGDTIYETDAKMSPAASDPFTDPKQALIDYHRKYRENIQPVNPGGFPSLQSFFASQGNYTLLDNHELGNKQFINGGAAPGNPQGAGVDAANQSNDVNNTAQYINKTPGFKLLVQAYSDYQPIREKIIKADNDPLINGTLQLYFAQPWGANAILINVDDRSYRDIRLKTANHKDDTGIRADNPQRTMLGKTQLNWLKQTLTNAQTKGVIWKFIAISSPIDETGDDGGKSWMGGYRAERNDLLQYIADQRIENVVFLTTDDHQNRVNELTYLDHNGTKRVLPKAFTIVDGPIGADGPNVFLDHSFSNLKLTVDKLITAQKSKGINPFGLDPAHPGLKNVFREDDQYADRLRQPIDFYSPDTFNYVTLDVSADGQTLSVKTFGINSYPPNIFPEPNQVGPVRQILGFDIQVN